jgi:RND family efflux transporter MFP subunit
VIEAPFDGTIGISLVKLGSSVSAGQTLLNTISSDDPMAVDIAVDEKQIPRFARMLQGGTDGEDSTFLLVLPDQSLYPQTGELSLLDRAIDPQTGTLRVRLVFPNPQGLLKAGLTCNLRVRSSSGTNSLLIPYRAVVEQMGEYAVFVVAGGKASQRRVSLGRRVSDMVVVNAGLQPGDQVVTEGVQKLRDNAPVAANQQGAQAPGAPVQGGGVQQQGGPPQQQSQGVPQQQPQGQQGGQPPGQQQQQQSQQQQQPQNGK